MDEQALSQLIGLIYEGVTDDSCWEVIASRISQATGESAVVFDSANLKNLVPGLTTFTNFDAELANLHFEEYDSPDNNPGVAALLKAELNRPFSLASFVDQHTYDSDPSIRAILHPQQFDKGLFVALENSADAFSYFGLFRRNRDAEFDQRDSRFLNLISPHLQRALDLRSKLGRKSGSGIVLEQTDPVTSLSRGVILVSSTNLILEKNATAATILNSDTGLKVRNGRLISTSKRPGETQADLMEFLRSNKVDQGPFVIRTSQNAFLILKSINVQFAAGKYQNQSQRALLLSVVHNSDLPDAAMFSAVYGLTPAQEKVVRALVRSRNATEAALRMNITRETIKNHLEQIYEKTETGSLPQLMLLIGKFSG